MGRVVVVLLVMLLTTAAVGGCGSTATDANEPNDDLGSACTLAPMAPTQGVIGSDDSDVFRCETPDGAGVHTFVVNVRTDAPDDIDLEVGASVPGAWEGITWPGWKATSTGDGLEVTASLRKGTVIAVLTGASGAEYSIEIVWE